MMEIYKLSGKVSPLGTLRAFLWGFLWTCVSSFIYGVFTYYVPTIYLLWLPTGLYSLILGLAIGATLRSGHVRNIKVATIFSFIFGFLGVYFSWVVWLSFYASNLASEAHLFWKPFEFFNEILHLGPLRALWTVSRNLYATFLTLEGTSVYWRWLTEALAIICLTTFFALTTFYRAVFCEKCYHWFSEDNDKLLFLEALNENLTRPRLIAGDLSVLNEIGVYQNLPPGEGELPKPLTLVTLRRCKNCPSTYLLNIDEITYRHRFYTGKYGGRIETNKIDNDQVELLSNVIIGKNLYTDLEARL